MYVKNKKTNIAYSAVAASSNNNSGRGNNEPSTCDRPGYVLINDNESFFIDTFRMYDKYEVLPDALVNSIVLVATEMIPAELQATWNITEAETDVSLTVIPEVLFNWDNPDYLNVTITADGVEVSNEDFEVEQLEDQNAFTITFDNPLTVDTQYEIAIETIQQSTSRTFEMTRSFTTAPLQTVTSNHTTGATGVSVATNLVMTYLHELVDSTSTFALTATVGGAAKAAAVTYDTAKKVVTINPTTDFAAATGYTLTCHAVDVTGQTLNTVITFTTL